MGYYTDYNFEENTRDVIIAINSISGYGDEGEDDESTGYFGVKWYSWDEHMREVSKKFPDQVIKLEGDGEESGDTWIAYFKNGKAQVARPTITYEPYDENKLK